jgi:signal transduction histidine kinase
MERNRAYLATFGACMAIALAMWIGTGIILAQLHRSIEEDAAVRRQNLARSLSEHQASSVRAIDLSLVFLRDLLRQNPRDFGDAVRRHEDLLHKEKVIQVAVIDAQGDLVYSRLPQPAGVNFRDRGYFATHRDSGRDTLVISEPVFGRVTQRWAIQLSRPVRDERGQFAGLIVMAVPPPLLESVYNDIDLGADGVVTLIRNDGQVLARSADFEKVVRYPLAAWPAIAQRRVTAGEFVARGAVDGVERYFSYRKLDDYGIAVLVGHSVSAVMAPYVKQRNYVLAMVTAATLFLFAVAFAIVLRQRDKARFAAQHESLMLELHDGCIQAIYAVGLRLQGARGLAHSDPASVARTIAEAEADLNLVIQELRTFIGGGRPRAYSAEEFLAQVQRSIPATHRAMFSVDIDAEVAMGLPPEKSEHVLRIVREAAANVARHASAHSARITLARRDDRVRLSVDDDGHGQAAGARDDSGLGLAHIQARAKRLGGRASIESIPGTGTRVTVEFPG